MKKLLLTSALCASLFTASLPAHAADGASFVQNYAAMVYANYSDSYRDTLALQKAVNTFLTEPNEANLGKARQAWLTSRDSYGQTEAFRFYEGPIDFVDDKKGVEGPEGRLNAWPLNEAYIDYVVGNKEAGIVNDKGTPITKETLSAKNQENDEADVSTGYHAIEFLLWGQDLSLDSTGQRPASDYAKMPENERRRDYLKAATDLLVDDVKFLVDSWQPGKDNYAKRFTTQDTKESLQDILTALATLSGFELASERIATALDSGDQEDEHSCFSDNTHKDFIMNAKGISNVFFGKYGKIKGTSLYELLKEKDEELAEALEHQIFGTAELIDNIPHPVDRELLATPKGSPARQNAEKVVASLQKEADLFKQAGKVLGVDVKIMSE